MDSKKMEYIKYFEHMEFEHQKIPLGGMAWDDVGHWVAGAISNGFTLEELIDKFPILLGRFKEESK